MDQVVGENGDTDSTLVASKRREWELSERIADLDRRLRAMTEADRMREVELQALRQELELRIAHGALIERVATERQAQIEWFTKEVDSLRAELQAERGRVSQLDAELQAERGRISHRLASTTAARKGVRLVRRVTGLARSRD